DLEVPNYGPECPGFCPPGEPGPGVPPSPGLIGPGMVPPPGMPVEPGMPYDDPMIAPPASPALPPPSPPVLDEQAAARSRRALKTRQASSQTVVKTNPVPKASGVEPAVNSTGSKPGLIEP